jgi:3D (Asp-Asp-Asp) domain-containing protein
MNAGRYSGVYTVTDTGRDVKGRHIDLFIPREAAAKEFGEKVVLVSVLRWGTPSS